MNGNALEIRLISDNKKAFLPLLLLADEQEDMIDKYLERGDLYALYDAGELIGTCVVTQEDADTCELQSLAVAPERQRRGYGAYLVRAMCERYAGRYSRMVLGTGDTPSILAFYRHCGFALFHRLEGYFLEHYDHPMFEDGVQLIDKVYLGKALRWPSGQSTLTLSLP